MKRKAILVPACLLALLLATGVYGGESHPSYELRDGYDTGPAPLEMELFLLEGDDSPEIITLNEGDSQTPFPSLSILRNDGNGTYPTRLDVALDAKPSGFVVADFNGDLLPDVAITRGEVIGFGNVTILLNNGAGLEQAGTVALGRSPGSIAAFDLDGDGDNDLAVANYRDHSLTVLVNDGTGTFSRGEDHPVFPHPTSVTGADLNGDGAADLLAASDGWETDTYRLNIFLNSGNGTFLPALNYTTGKGPSKLLSRDLDGDGLPELVTLSKGVGEVRIRKNLGNGFFSDAEVYTFENGARDILVADLDSDDAPDILALAGELSRSVEALVNLGNGTFKHMHLFSVSKGAERLAVAFPGPDAPPDIMTLDRQEGRLEIHSAISPETGNENERTPRDILDSIFGGIIPLNNPYVAVLLALIICVSVGVVILAGKGKGHKKAKNSDDASKEDAARSGSKPPGGARAPEAISRPKTPPTNGPGGLSASKPAAPAKPVSHDAFRPPPGMGSAPVRKVKGGSNPEIGKSDDK